MGKYCELKGKRVMVTGAASGIGLATAQRFAAEGAKVFIIDCNRDALAKAMGDNPLFAGSGVCDVSREEDVLSVFNKMDSELGGIDVLVSNAGISIRKDFVDISYEQWQKVININLNGMFLCSREAARRMKAQKSGVILMTASTNGTEGSWRKLPLAWPSRPASLRPACRPTALLGSSTLRPRSRSDESPAAVDLPFDLLIQKKSSSTSGNST